MTPKTITLCMRILIFIIKSFGYNILAVLAWDGEKYC